MSNEYLESNLKKSSMWYECVKIQVKYGEISEKCHNIRKALPVPFANILSWNWLAWAPGQIVPTFKCNTGFSNAR